MTQVSSSRRSLTRSSDRRDGILDAFSQLVRRRGGDPIVASPTRAASYTAVDDLSRSVAKLVAQGPFEAGALIGLAAPNGPAFLAGFLAIRRAGMAALLLDSLAPSEDRQRAARELGAAAILECGQAWPTSAEEFRLSRVGSEAPPAGMRDIAVVKLTSGSTGAPRGVAMSTDTQLADEAAFALTMGLSAKDRPLAAIPWSHAYGFTILALSALVRGAVLVLPKDRNPFSPLAAGEELGATVFPTVPAYVQGVLQMSHPPPLPSQVRLVISAGAVLPIAVAARFRETYGQQVHVLYGSSECGGICYDRDGGAAERGTVGTPLEGVRVSISRQATENGDENLDEGIVVVESPAVGETYVPDPDSRLAAGRFETCDVGAWHGGELVLRRRIDRVINVRGRKVDPTEVEGVLAGLRGVHDVVVLGVPSNGRREEIVRAVVACPSGELGQQDVISWCRPRLADHKVPRSVVIVDAIPRTSRGKVDRTALLTLRPGDKGRGEIHG